MGIIPVAQHNGWVGNPVVLSEREIKSRKNNEYFLFISPVI